MDDLFIIPLDYMGKSYEFETKIMSYGYTYRIEVDVEGTKVIFEPDEERNYRAILNKEQMTNVNTLPDNGLLQAVAAALESLHN